MNLIHFTLDKTIANQNHIRLIDVNLFCGCKYETEIINRKLIFTNKNIPHIIKKTISQHFRNNLMID